MSYGISACSSGNHSKGAGAGGSVNGDVLPQNCGVFPKPRHLHGDWRPIHGGGIPSAKLLCRHPTAGSVTSVSPKCVQCCSITFFQHSSNV